MKTKKRIKLAGLTTISLLIFSVLFKACALSPEAWQPPVKPEMKGVLTENNLLSKSTWIDLKEWYGPEDIATDKYGNLYCGVHAKGSFNDGAILKIDTSHNVSVYCHTNAWVAGLHFDKNDNLIACDSKKGLIKIDQNGEYTILTDRDESGNPFLIPNDVDIAKDGKIYFSNTSSKLRFSPLNARKIILEAKSDGGLYSYDPTTKIVKTLIDSSYFGNGVAVSQNDDFVLMVDLTKYRILRYWLKGNKKGSTEIFMENLPGFPNGISRRKDGTFWIGFSTKRIGSVDKIHPKIWLKKFIFSIPDWMQPKQVPYGMILNVSETGKIIKAYFDTTGDYVSEASSIEERDGYLYIGGDLPNHIVKYKL